jgi:uncharacterized membrane protein YfcA
VETYTYLEITILLLAGIITGIVNTAAGSGTIFSVGSMIFLDIPIELANITNRLGVFFQNIAGILSFKRFGNIKMSNLPLMAIIATFIGALVGAYFASEISTETLEFVALIVISIMILSTIIDLFRKQRVSSVSRGIDKMYRPLIFILIGFYGGLIQIGIGILVLIGLRQTYNFDWNEANYIKLLIILIYTVPTLLFFVHKSMIVWLPGVCLAIGQVVGGYASGWLFNFNFRLRNAIPYLILVMLCATALKILI